MGSTQIKILGIKNSVRTIFCRTIILCSFYLMSGNIFSFSNQFMMIYGEDDRLEYSQHFVVKNLMKAASSVSAMIDRNEFSQENKNGKEYYKLNYKSLQKKHPNISSDQLRFPHQTSNALCSGVLVGEDLLATANHCVRDGRICKQVFWVFDYYQEHMENPESQFFKSEQVFQCIEIIRGAYDPGKGLDYALVRLDRAVNLEQRFIPNHRIKGKIFPYSNLVMLGHSMGLPLKISPRANVLGNSHPYYFSANLDAFYANSGSPVFSLDYTGEFFLEGILIQGQKDFCKDSRNPSKKKLCQTTRFGDGEFLFGERVARISEVLGYINSDKEKNSDGKN